MRQDRRDLLVGGTTALVAAPRLAAAEPLAIDEGVFVDVNGVEQWVTLRGSDRRNPILLWLHGGPGASMSQYAPLFAEWEQHFTLVQWDQPGGGATAVRNFGLPAGEMSIDRYVRDGLAVADYARARLGARKVVLMGISFGTLLGLEMIQRRPDLFSAYVGTSQTVGLPSLRAGYDLALADCRRRGDDAAVAALDGAGAPPYASLDKFLVRQAYTNPPGQPMTAADQARSAAATAVMKAAPTTGVRYLSGLPNPQGYNPGQAFIGTLAAMFGQTGNWDARKLGTAFSVPIHVFQGDNDFNTPAEPVRAWLQEVRAPSKVFATLPGASHNTVPYHAEMLALLRRHVWPLARRAA